MIRLNFRDRFRTTVNIIADALAAGVIEHLTRGDDLASDKLEETARPLNGDYAHLSNAGPSDDFTIRGTLNNS